MKEGDAHLKNKPGGGEIRGKKGVKTTHSAMVCKNNGWGKKMGGDGKMRKNIVGHLVSFF